MITITPVVGPNPPTCHSCEERTPATHNVHIGNSRGGMYNRLCDGCLTKLQLALEGVRMMWDKKRIREATRA